jgi:hypothetical protein
MPLFVMTGRKREARRAGCPGRDELRDNILMPMDAF